MITVFPDLDPLLFDYRNGETQPILNPLVQKQIQMALGTIFTVVPVKWTVLTGDALKVSDRSAPLKVILGIQDNDENERRTKYMINVLQGIVGRMNNNSIALGTQHPISYIVTTKKYDQIDFRDAYALLDDRWLKTSYNPTMQEKIEVERPTSKRQYMQGIFRGLDRKSPYYIPAIYKEQETEIHFSKIPFESAKRSQSGIWRVSLVQVKEICKHFHITHLPKKIKPYKMLGNTGIMIFRPKRNLFFLVKGSYAIKVRKAFKHINYA